MKKLTRFLFAGGVGFAVDVACLALLLALTPLNPFGARIVSIAMALWATWMINRHLTFGPSSRGMAREGARYGSVGIASSVVNYATYSALIVTVPTIPPLVALAVGSATATAVSWLGYSRLVFDR